MKSIDQQLLAWYKKKNYQFPWRNNTSPYNIWISEIMLQQTQVKTVIPYYRQWIHKYPNIQTLFITHLARIRIL